MPSLQRYETVVDFFLHRALKNKAVVGGKLCELSRPKQPKRNKYLPASSLRPKYEGIFKLNKPRKLFLVLCKTLFLCRFIFRNLKLTKKEPQNPYQSQAFKPLLEKYFTYVMPISRKTVSSIKHFSSVFFRRKSKINKKRLNKLNKKIFTKGKITKRILKRRLYWEKNK